MVSVPEVLKMKQVRVLILIAVIALFINGCQDVQENNVDQPSGGKVEEPKPAESVQPEKVEPPEPVNLDTDPALMGWWKFEETAGTRAEDSSSYGRKGELKGEFTFDKDSVTGKVGNALRFDGKNGLVQITGYKGVTGTKPRTLAAWIKSKRAVGVIADWGVEEPGAMWIVRFYRARPGATPMGGYLYMNDQINDDQWHHVAVVVAQADLPNLHDHVTLYLDGQEAEIHDIGLLDMWPIETGAEIDVRIGRGFQGAIDEVRIYERALSAEEIGKIKNVK